MSLSAGSGRPCRVLHSSWHQRKTSWSASWRRGRRRTGLHMERLRWLHCEELINLRVSPSLMKHQSSLCTCLSRIVARALRPVIAARA